MSGEFNTPLVDKVGANKLIAKFDPNERATTVRPVVEPWQQQTPTPDSDS